MNVNSSIFIVAPSNLPGVRHVPEGIACVVSELGWVKNAPADCHFWKLETKSEIPAIFGLI